MTRCMLVAENERKAEVQNTLEHLRELKEKRKSLRSRLRKAEGLERKVLKAKCEKVCRVFHYLRRHETKYSMVMHILTLKPS
jgi:hypothetical protein